MRPQDPTCGALQCIEGAHQRDEIYDVHMDMVHMVRYVYDDIYDEIYAEITRSDMRCTPMCIEGAHHQDKIYDVYI